MEKKSLLKAVLVSLVILVLSFAGFWFWNNNTLFSSIDNPFDNQIQLQLNQNQIAFEAQSNIPGITINIRRCFTSRYF